MSLVVPKMTAPELLKFTSILQAVARDRTAILTVDMDETLRGVLIELTSPGGAIEGETLDEDAVKTQIESMINEAQKLLKDSKSLNVSDKISIFKAQSQLVEKWISLRERVTNVKQMAEFQQTILTFMDDILSADQRTDLMERLRSFNRNGQ